MFEIILFLLIFYFILLPLGRMLWRGWQFRRRWKEATAGMREAFSRAAYGGETKSSASKSKKKKIDSSVGEYVAFEEIKVDATVNAETSDGQQTANVRMESQIEDAVWEEIK